MLLVGPGCASSHLLLIGVANPQNARRNTSCWVLIVGRIQIQNPHLYLLVNRISLKFRFSTSPLLVNHLIVEPVPLLREIRETPYDCSSLIDWSSQSPKRRVKCFLLSIACRSRVVSSLRWPDHFQIQNPHLYLLVDQIGSKFKFKIRIAPLSTPSPLINSDSNSKSAPLLRIASSYTVLPSY